LRPIKSIGNCVAASAVLTQTLYFQHLANRRKAEIGCFLLNDVMNVAVIQFRNRAALSTDEELSGVPAVRICAAYVCIQRIEAMHQPGVDQEIESPVHSWRGGLFAVAIKAVEKLVSTDRLVTVPDQFEDSAPQVGEAQTVFAAQPVRRVDRLRNAVLVVMLGWRKTPRADRLIHTKVLSRRHANCTHKQTAGCQYIRYNSAPRATAESSKIRKTNNAKHSITRRQRTEI
jgi:hypothetical protein